MLSVSSKHCNVWQALPRSSLIVCGGNNCRHQCCQLPTSISSSGLLFLLFLPSFFFLLICLHFWSPGLHQFIRTRAGASCSPPLEAQIRQKLVRKQLGHAGYLRGVAVPTRDSLPLWGPASCHCTRACHRHLTDVDFSVFLVKVVVVLFRVSIHKQAVGSFSFLIRQI